MTQKLNKSNKNLNWKTAIFEWMLELLFHGCYPTTAGLSQTNTWHA